MKSWTVRATQEVSYEVRQTRGVLGLDNPDLADAAGLEAGARRLVVVDREVCRIYGAGIRAYFRHRDVDPVLLVLPADESNKTAASVFKVADAADHVGLNRRSDPIVAIGGGVLTDVVGLAASLYRRGTPYVRVPTTLIGLVDAAVGVKTAVNYHSHKNRLGTYFPAAVTLLDQGFLQTLPVRHIVNGLAEIIKMAVVRDAGLFDLLDDNAERLIEQMAQGDLGRRVIESAVAGMLGELTPNLWEHDLKRLVDFGHTFSPSIELAVDPPLLHGEAVAIDMALSCLIAQERGLLSSAETQRSLGLMRSVGLPLSHPRVTPEALIDGLAEATRHRDGNQHVPLPRGLGRTVFVEDIKPGEIRRAQRRSFELTGMWEAA
ncbi:MULTISPECIES: sedoheptulose 7-phosphate cyclase [unclassified Streptomyces]|uniref:sedoheptulose 7-phosphate cyclase n=1 Tax=unclassified Streptomyces TaxID=2593676 RepID=UPI00093CB775|nr:sedoheptulose 7-phosphate cyclase [Streptomyces sp. TSRI0281]OKI46325.1 2-epi-5-epi-valiolone synthase [Streptomyces sp. TSRI0281]